MEEKTKASKGASVAKTGTISGQSSALKTKPQWDQPATGLEGEASPSPVCQDNSPDNDPLSRIPASMRGKKPAEKQAIGEQIGRQLRSVYNDVLAQPVPDRFLDLLRELEKDPK
jgi:Anti-sigma factor NepR